MSAPASRPLPQPERFGRLWWLPSGGLGNGLDDTAWTPMADLPRAIVPALMGDLLAAGVPAYAAPLTQRPVGPGKRAQPPRSRLWVGTSRYGQAEEVLRIRLPVLLGHRGEPAG
jgi:hypothetical protein